jgi:hypothetical protein
MLSCIEIIKQETKKHHFWRWECSHRVKFCRLLLKKFAKVDLHLLSIIRTLFTHTHTLIFLHVNNWSSITRTFAVYDGAAQNLQSMMGGEKEKNIYHIKERQRGCDNSFTCKLFMSHIFFLISKVIYVPHYLIKNQCCLFLTLFNNKVLLFTNWNPEWRPRKYMNLAGNQITLLEIISLVFNQRFPKHPKCKLGQIR